MTPYSDKQMDGLAGRYERYLRVHRPVNVSRKATFLQFCQNPEFLEIHMDECLRMFDKPLMCCGVKVEVFLN